MKKTISFFLTVIMLFTTVSTSFAGSNINKLDKKLVTNTEGIYDLSKLSTKEIDELLKENINNDNEFRKLLKSKATKENKFLDINKYELDMAKTNTLEDIDKVLKKYEDKILFETRRDLTTEEFEILKSTSSNDSTIQASAVASDFEIIEIVSYTSESYLADKKGYFNQIAELGINITLAFTKPIFSIAYAILGSFGSNSEYYTSEMQVTTLVDSSLTNRNVKHKNNPYKSYAFADRKRVYNDVRLIIWDGGRKVYTDLKELGLVRDRYHNYFVNTSTLIQKAVEEYNRNGYGVSYLYSSSSANDLQYDKSYYFPATKLIK